MADVVTAIVELAITDTFSLLPEARDLIRDEAAIVVAASLRERRRLFWVDVPALLLLTDRLLDSCLCLCGGFKPRLRTTDRAKVREKVFAAL